MKLQFRSVLAVAGLSLVLSSVALGQGCLIGDDGFDNGCCALPTPTLPPFPQASMQANWGELRGCTPTNLNLVNVFLTPMAMVFCDYGLLNVNIAFPGGETINGQLVAKYARTFNLLPNPPGGQVWRFLVNGDLTCLPVAASTPCTSPLPKCAFVSPGFPVHFDGHIDYTCGITTAGTQAFSVSLSLNHHQGCISHAFWTCSPLTGLLQHVESSYHLVGPAPFTFGGATAPTGNLLGDAVRPSFLRTVPGLTYACQSEEKIGPLPFAGNISLGSSAGCLCAVTNGCNGSPIPCPAATACYENQIVTYTTCCGGTVSAPFGSTPVPIAPFNVTGFVAQKIGTWGALPQYPSGESLTAYAGILTYQRTSTAPGCAPVNWPIHFTVGVATTGSLALPFTTTGACGALAPPTTAFIDLANVLPLSSSAFPSPGYGCLSAADVVWSFNMP